jgi:flagellar biosynthetic protein FliR
MTLIGAFFILFYSVDAIAFALKDLIQNILDLVIPLLVDQRDG